MILFFFFFKQKTAYEMRISDWSSDVCSSDLTPTRLLNFIVLPAKGQQAQPSRRWMVTSTWSARRLHRLPKSCCSFAKQWRSPGMAGRRHALLPKRKKPAPFWHLYLRSEEHTSELQSLMRISYAVFCLKKKKINQKH